MLKTNYLLVFILFNTFNTTQDYTEACPSKGQFKKMYGSKMPLYSDIASGFNGIRNILGKGGFGTVKEMEYDNQTVAVKKIIVVNANVRYLLSKEIEILNVIRNAGDLPGLPVFINCMQTSTVERPKKWFLYIFQEKLYKDLASKNSILFRKVVSDKWHRLSRYQDFARGIRSLHALNIVHSDIKPENLMATDKDFSNFKLIDFGISGYRGEDLIGGTRTFYPPEKLNGSCKNQSRSSDIWAYGLTVPMIESSFETILKGCTNNDFSKRGLTSQCKNNIIKNVKKVMNNVYGIDQRNQDGSCLNFTCVIFKCLETDPAFRPTAEELVSKIHELFKNEQERREEIMNKNQKLEIQDIPIVETDLEIEGNENLDHHSMLDVDNEYLEPGSEEEYNQKLKMIRKRQFFEERENELETIDNNAKNGQFLINKNFDYEKYRIEKIKKIEEDLKKNFGPMILAMSPDEENLKNKNFKNPYVERKVLI